MSTLQSHGTSRPVDAQRRRPRTGLKFHTQSFYAAYNLPVLRNGEGTWQLLQQTVLPSNRQWLAMGGAATTLPGCGRRLWAPAGFLVFTAGVCRISARPWSASVGAMSRRPVRLRTISVLLADRCPSRRHSISSSVDAFDDLGDHARPDQARRGARLQPARVARGTCHRSGQARNPRHHRKADGDRGGRRAGADGRGEGHRRARCGLSDQAVVPDGRRIAGTDPGRRARPGQCHSRRIHVLGFQSRQLGLGIRSQDRRNLLRHSGSRRALARFG